MSPYWQDETPELVESTMEKVLELDGIVKGAIMTEPLDPGSFWKTALPIVAVLGQICGVIGNSPDHNDKKLLNPQLPPVTFTVTHVPGGGA